METNRAVILFNRLRKYAMIFKRIWTTKKVKNILISLIDVLIVLANNQI
jgi:hypothetical protein